MGIHDVDTMNIIREKLNSLNPKIMLYGEGWNLQTALKKELRATKSNSDKLPHIGFFNDIIRDTLKGSVFQKNDRGFISGKEKLENGVKLSITGCIQYMYLVDGIFNSPDQSVNYICCHDNNTLWDKLFLSNSNEPEDVRIERQKFACGIILTCQGIPFLHSGVEFLRTKQGVENSFKSPDNINWIDWDRKDKYLYITNYIKGLINIRRKHPAFRLSSSEGIRRHLEFLNNTPPNTVAFLLKNKANLDDWNNLLIVYNANNNQININLPKGSWNLVVDKYNIDEKTIRTYTNNYTIDSISISIFYNTAEDFQVNAL